MIYDRVFAPQRSTNVDQNTLAYLDSKIEKTKTIKIIISIRECEFRKKTFSTLTFYYIKIRSEIVF